MSQQLIDKVFQDMKRYMKFAKSPNYVNKNNEFLSTYKPLFESINNAFKKNPTIFTSAKVTELNNRANNETNAEMQLSKTVLSASMITKKKLQILLNNYNAFKYPRVALTYSQRNELLVKQIENRPQGIDITDLDKKAMDQVIILILRDGKPTSVNESQLKMRKNILDTEIATLVSMMQTQPEQKKRITSREINRKKIELIGIDNQLSKAKRDLENYNLKILPKSNAYIKVNFYDKPEFSSYFTEEKKKELVDRSNTSETIQIESYEDMGTYLNMNKGNIGVM
jgi:hypothetical protein